MIKQIIAYLAVFLLTLYCFFLYNDEILTILLVIEIIYPGASLLWLEYLRKRVDVKLESVIPIAEKNQEIPISLLVQNHSKFASAHVRTLVKVENVFTGERENIKSTCVVKKNGTERMSFVIKSANCGNVSISLKSYFIYDFLLILNRKKNIKKVQNVGILPECHLIPVEVTRRTREFIADADEYSDRESGDDPSEIYQIREYRDKDSLHDIHWKLSAKTDELLVKEHGRPLGCVVLIWLNLQMDGKGKKYVPSALLEVAASLSMSLLEAECVHMVAWYEPENQKVQKKQIRKEENIYELLNRLLYANAYGENVDNQFENAFRVDNFSTIVELRTDGSVFVNKEEKLKIPLDEKQIVWDELYFVL